MTASIDLTIEPGPEPGRSLDGSLERGERERLLLMLQELRAQVVIPRLIPLDLSIPFGFVDSSGLPALLPRPRAYPRLHSRIAFTLHRDGRVSDVELQLPSIAPAVDTALVVALRSASDSGTLASLLAVYDEQGRRAEAPEALRLAVGVSSSSSRNLVALPLFKIRLPAYRDFVPARMAIGSPGPHYPDDARRRRIEDEVEAVFLVGPDGVADVSIARVLRATYSDFALAVLRALPEMRFTPATVSGCAVPQLVQQPFTFRIAR